MTPEERARLVTPEGRKHDAFVYYLSQYIYNEMSKRWMWRAAQALYAHKVLGSVFSDMVDRYGVDYAAAVRDLPEWNRMMRRGGSTSWSEVFTFLATVQENGIEMPTTHEGRLQDRLQATG